MNIIEQRVKRVLASRVESYVIDKLGGDGPDDLREAREREKQARLRALARASASGDSGGAVSEPGPRGIEAIMAEEDCPVCTKILSAVSEMPEPRRTKGVAEYGEFRRAIEESEEAAVEVLESSEILSDALQEIREVGL